MSRIIAIADIHGNNKKFREALKAVSLKKVDTLVLLGDLIDRGSYSKDVLDTLLLLKKEGFDNIIYIRGNHEQMLLDAYYDENKEYIWLKNGGEKTLQSFRVNFCNQIPNNYIKLIETSVLYYFFEDFLFIHAGVNFEHANPLDDKESLLWLRKISKDLYKKSSFASKKIVHGHTPISREEILQQFSEMEIINIDNGVYFKEEGYGKLTIADFTNSKIYFI